MNSDYVAISAHLGVPVAIRFGLRGSNFYRELYNYSQAPRQDIVCFEFSFEKPCSIWRRSTFLSGEIVTVLNADSFLPIDKRSRQCENVS